MSVCVSRHGEFSSHTRGSGSGPRVNYTCIHCGAFDQDGCLEELVDANARLTKLKKEIEDQGDVILDAVEALKQGQAAVFDAIALTYREGPGVGMDRVLRWLLETDVPAWGMPEVPYDWLSRWEVKLT